MSLVESLERAFARHAPRPALTVAGEASSTITYAELAAEARGRAVALRAAGLGRRDVACLALRRGPDLVAHLLGSLLAGGVFCALPERARWPQLRHAQRVTGAPLTLVDGATLALLDRPPDGEDGGPPLRAVGPLSPLARRRLEALAPLGAAAPWVDLEAPPDGPAPDLDEDPGCCLMTSGSSGVPKVVLVSRGDLLRRAAREVADYGLTPDDRLLGLLPFSFDVGLNQLLSCLLAGAELVLAASWLPAEIAATTARHRITGISAVPDIWRQVIAAGAPLGGLRYLAVSGGALEPAAMARLAALAPSAGLFKTYGQTELFRATMLRPEDATPARWATVGRALPGCEVVVVDAALRPVPPGTPGQVLHRGAGTMMGYVGDPEGTARKLAPGPALPGVGAPGGERWVHTGDVGVLDADGFLTLLGREDMMLKVMGHRVYPAEVEAALRACPDVVDAAVVGAPDPLTGQRIVAFAVPRTPGPDLAARLLAQLRERLPPYMVPAALELREDLPRTASGKLAYAELRAAIEGGAP
jgi:acyl-CoA synthetase (AMP-forming)/AMP-acid ligase II